MKKTFFSPVENMFFLRPHQDLSANLLPFYWLSYLLGL